MTFDLHKLRLLRELKHRGTLSAVAAALSYSPSSVSQQLSQLEAQVGLPLLEPVGRRVRLTPQAEILVGHTEAVLEQLERAEADIAASLAGPTGRLRIACYQTAAFALAPNALTCCATPTRDYGSTSPRPSPSRPFPPCSPTTSTWS
ncbi:LysR family transcriptional regulator [Streptomyces griseocarneus]|uniref:LysR family transcriptional regulator n=1 Tax=Streptomyces griseocarneus TaxID=51201 RepID=UPI001F622022|nr:LysR family transcriptional regulator [Streptomyces griseocarneus]